MPDKPHLYLIDGSAFIFRAYHALPPLTRKSDGMPIGAVSGFCNMLWKLIQQARTPEGPSHLAVIFDAKGKTFRNDIYEQYKAHRPPAPEDLVPQFPVIKQLVKAFHVPAIEKSGFEADDIMATYAKDGVAAGMKVTLVTSDKDMMQLINDDVDMLDTMKNKFISYDGVMEKFGVHPNRVIDIQALAGDSADNVPGVPGIGVKTAALLINEYGDLDTLLERAGEIKQNKRRENLIEFADLARVSRTLVTLKDDVELDEKVQDFKLAYPDIDELLNHLQDLGLNSAVKRIANAHDADIPLKEASTSAKPTAKIGDDFTPASLAQKRAQKLASMPVKPDDYQSIISLDKLNEYIAKIYDGGQVSFDLETDSLNPIEANIVGICLSTQAGEGVYIPVAHKIKSEKLDLFAAETTDETIEQIDFDVVMAIMKNLLEDASILKIGQNLKYDISVLKKYSIHLKSFHDTMLISAALDTGRTNHGMDALSEYHFDHKPIAFKDVCGSGKSQITFDYVPLDLATKYGAEDADVTLRLFQTLYPRLAAEKATQVYQSMERPLVNILVDMEQHGIKVDREKLQQLSATFGEKLAVLTTEIYQLAGQEFNIASPKQLGEILFEKLGLPGGKKTKTGAWQTGAKVLDDLAAEGHELPVKMLEWRGLSKLKSTYTDSLPNHINPNTGRIHTSYAMAHTTTGRLASTDPNLQNIPVRTEEGRQIRTAFISEAGHHLISADYSQIELRLLAHIADLKTMKQAFADGVDIHALTASEMFNVPIDGMDSSIRRQAKAINFGIIYGISAFGLSVQLGISRTEAKDYIEKYFTRFPGIRDYMEDTKQFAREHEYVKTIFGRVCHMPHINDKNGMHRAFTERAAINMPIQGAAADIIKRAMVQMPNALNQAGLKAKMLLQVHDELIFEAPDDEVKQTIIIAKKIMENAHNPVVQIDVPLKVDAQAALNWNDAH
ncbi:MAG: DNA polymerase I [Rhizobiales bacterium]|nr:DNA polymerase I [Hyphomicrobiales bacterium]NRB14455.1 DNA polymerase I [Hyphomicrobiales bacterium]